MLMSISVLIMSPKKSQSIRESYGQIFFPYGEKMLHDWVLKKVKHGVI